MTFKTFFGEVKFGLFLGEDGEWRYEKNGAIALDPIGSLQGFLFQTVRHQSLELVSQRERIARLEAELAEARKAEAVLGEIMRAPEGTVHEWVRIEERDAARAEAESWRNKALDAGNHPAVKVLLEERDAARAECAALREALLERCPHHDRPLLPDGSGYLTSPKRVPEHFNGSMQWKCGLSESERGALSFSTIGAEYAARVKRLVEASREGHAVMKSETSCPCDDGKPEDCWVGRAVREWE